MMKDLLPSLKLEQDKDVPLIAAVQIVMEVLASIIKQGQAIKGL